MKKSAFIFASAILAAIMCVFTGCSDEDNEDYVKFPDAPSDEVITWLATTTTPVAFKTTGGHRWIDRVKGGKWVAHQMNPLAYYFFDGMGPSEIIFRDGKVFCRLGTLHGNSWSKEDGSTAEIFILQVWDTYTADTYAQRIYVVNDFDYNKNAQTIRFDSREFGLISCDKNELVISSMGENSRRWEYYEQTSVSEGEDHFFESSEDAYRFILTSAREKYGDEMVVKRFLPNGEVYSEREINLDFLEKDWNDGW